ncbi:RNA polymerase factor sigma-54 [Acetobacterium bakii]|uniref:DNA-directed RNA polymerase subunit sigma n=1 Tax=Acetobacterium bakii TaxID=52689 RepID=A0A0L6U3K4_9FIRM|nr:RNA polymerase factor sigma-54 [Acetobacterium bakii]KNZ42917.1 DNA-directed RNA polymerase subunit sigma [Acetobacterium bakii]
MNIKFDLNITQTQKLIMTQEMRQAIEILQLTSMELNNLIENEIMENPVLEFNEVSIKTLAPETGEAAKEDVNKKDDINWDDYFNSMEPSEYRGQTPTNYDPDEEYGFEKFSYQEKTLNEYLHFQFNMVVEKLSKREIFIGEYLIDCIDDNGYLIVDMDYLQEILESNEENINKIIGIIQGFDPVGVGARDIKECLLIQLRYLGYENDDIYMEIINQHLTDLADNQYKRIAHATGLSLEEVFEFKELIKTLEPKPGREFTNLEGVSYVIPDGSIEIVDGELIVKINEISAPRLKINSFYKGMLKKTDQNEDTRKYLEKKLDGAVFLIRSIEQRRDTILKVIQAIATCQKNFFFQGVEDLRPLTLNSIADMIDVHESTVSRAIRGKYVQTPKGTFALKFFFKRGFNHGEEDLSSDAIKQFIQEMVEVEDKRKPLSDQKISEILKEKNLEVARRTIAKYREALSIQPSSKRKEYR